MLNTEEETRSLKAATVRALTICQPSSLSRIPSEEEARQYVHDLEARVAELKDQLDAATDPTLEGIVSLPTHPRKEG